ncbi:MAG TPA: hypothetical protein VE261_08740 [Gaiellaceae bacterium]|nr:hypothetical protein [Gaiellaceae bacterium]
MTEDEEWEAVGAALREAGIDPTDLARFVNDPHPELPGFEPSTFDSLRAYPVLMAWLPRVQAPAVVETLASRIRESGKRSDSARALIAKYRERPGWSLGDAVARTMTPAEHEDVVDLCADRSAGRTRQMLVYSLWRIKTPRARELIRELLGDPAVCGHAMYSARRAFGNDEAKRLIEPLAGHADETVRGHAVETLKRIARLGR